MCPIFEYACEDGHRTETIRPANRRADYLPCAQCGKATTPQFPTRTHCPPDGVYSYAPNIGCPERFERQRQAIKDGTRVIKREPDAGSVRD
jgi:hypothetical protein